MSCLPRPAKLADLIEQFRTGVLLLPDFQRPYKWKPKEDMKPLLASFILEYPIGGFLLGKTTSQAFRAREPECFSKKNYLESLSSLSSSNETITKNTQVCDVLDGEGCKSYESYFLFDGQQRLTTIEMIFGDGYYNSSRRPLDRPRWFLNLNMLGLDTLDFPENLDYSSFDDICNDDGEKSYIVHIDYNKNNTESHPLHPKNKTKSIFTDFCTDKGENKYGYLFPLDSVFSKNFDTIKSSLLYRNHEKILLCSTAYKDLCDLHLPEEQFQDKADELRAKIDEWISSFSELMDRVRNYQLPVIDVSSDQLSRVAGIFEVINKQGIALHIFDLLLARSIKPKSDSIRDTLQLSLKESYEEQSSKYMVTPDLLPTPIRKLFEEEEFIWNPSQFFGGGQKTNKGEDSPDQIMSPYARFISLYARLYSLDSEDFFNCVAPRTLSDVNNELNKSNMSWGFSDREILKTERELVCTVQKQAIIQLIRASIFCNFKLGISKFTDLAYQQMIFVIALCMTDDFWNLFVNDTESIKSRKLQSWYWSSIFSGEYQKSQDLKVLHDSIETLNYVIFEKNSVSIEARKDKLFNCLGYSDLETLKLGAGKAISNTILQFELRNGMQDFKSKDISNVPHRGPMLCSLQNVELQVDHIISIENYNKKTGSMLERKSEHSINSPLNKTYLSKSSNRYKGELSPLDFLELSKVAKSPNGEETKVLDSHMINVEVLTSLYHKENTMDPGKFYELFLDKLVESRFDELRKRVNKAVEVS